VLSIPRHPTQRVLLMTTYAAGLRVSEVVRLQLTDLDRERLMIRVEQGKPRTDRSTILSPLSSLSLCRGVSGPLPLRMLTYDPLSDPARADARPGHSGTSPTWPELRFPHGHS
jgi:integrase